MDINKDPPDPDLDGVTHINVYSRGATPLGRKLSNFAHTPFTLPVEGYFASIEAYWYWLCIAPVRDSQEFKAVRSLHGFKCKELGRKALQRCVDLGVKTEVPHFKSKIKAALLAKIEQTKDLSSDLRESKLPLTHYYHWGDAKPYKVSVPEKYLWITDYIADVRQYLKGDACKLVIAGSREITDFDLIESAYKEFSLKNKVIEIVSGMARGPDLLGVELAKKYELPWMEFPADWNGPLGKGAGFARNEEMAKHATGALVFWDGKSTGTEDMLKRIRRRNLPVELVIVPSSPKGC